MAKTSESDNLGLWKLLEKTDPAVTKRVEQRGGFTSVCSQHQIHNATAEWGPYGKTWGVKECVYGYVRNAAGEPIEATLEAVFWYPGGEFQISTDLAYRPNGDSRKKLLTDLTTKALSKLGFNADVFLGKFDDNKYLAERRAEVAKENGTAPPNGLAAAEKRLVSDIIDSRHCTKEAAVAAIGAVIQERLGKPRIETMDEMDQVSIAMMTGSAT